MSLRFELHGVGYVAPRHLEAMKAVGGELIVAYDPHDNVGILDGYFPGCIFNPKYFDIPDYCVIASPNYTHFQIIAKALEVGIPVICEKPVVLTTSDFDNLQSMSVKCDTKIFPILQLRFHPEFRRLQDHVRTYSADSVDVDYWTNRGNWYHNSWKGDEGDSGGLVYNIGIHIIDVIQQAFFDYEVTLLAVQEKTKETVSFILQAIREPEASVDIRFHLSISQDLPVKRTVEVDGTTFDFGKKIDGLHTWCYEAIIRDDGSAPSLESARDSIAMCEEISKWKS